jgi:hypothetical protein
MFIYSLPVSSLYCCIDMLCLHQCLLLTFFFEIYVLLLCLCTSVFSLSAAAHSLFYPHESLSTATRISSLFCVFIVSVHLLHSSCAMPLHTFHCIIVLPTGHSLHFFIPSTSLNHRITSPLYAASVFCQVIS